MAEHLGRTGDPRHPGADEELRSSVTLPLARTAISAEPYSEQGKYLGRHPREGHDLGRTAPEGRLRRHL